jgi:hypothetical protein
MKYWLLFESRIRLEPNDSYTGVLSRDLNLFHLMSCKVSSLLILAMLQPLHLNLYK